MFDAFLKDLLLQLKRLSDRITKLETTEAAEAYHGGVHAYMNNDSIWLNAGAGYTALTFDSEAWDTDSFFTAGGSLFTVPRTGRYLVTCNIPFTYSIPAFASPPMQTDFRFSINAGTYVYYSSGVDPLWYDTVGMVYNQSLFSWQRSVILNLVANDTLFIEGEVPAGMAANTNVQGSGAADEYTTPWLEIEYLGV